MTIMESESVLPCPLFEGSEKRLAAEFSFGAASPIEGLRALSRGQLDALLRQVGQSSIITACYSPFCWHSCRVRCKQTCRERWSCCLG